MSVCKPCGATFRKGRRVLVPDGSGRLVGQIVCPACAALALRILPSGGVTCIGCSTRPAEWCGVCVQDSLKRAVQSQVDRIGLVKVLRALASTYTKTADEEENEYRAGLEAGITIAADKIEGGA